MAEFNSPQRQRERRERLKLSLEELGRAASIPAEAVRAYEAGTAIDSNVAAEIELALQRFEVERGAP